MLRGVPGDRAALVSLRAYTDVYYSPVNELLRYTAGATAALSDDARLAGPIIQGITTAIHGMAPTRFPVARALSSSRIPIGFIDAHQRGNIVRYGGFTSTTAGRQRDTDLTVWIEHLSGRSIAHVSVHPDELEVLIPSGALFMVDDARPGMIWLREIMADQVRGRRVHEFTLD